MNKMYQKLKKKCISLVLFALLAAFIVPYYAYAASSGAESATETSVTDSTGVFSVSESSEKKATTESSKEEQYQTREEEKAEEKNSSNTEDVSSADRNESTSAQAGADVTDASKNVEANTQESTEEEQPLTKKEIKTVRKNLQLGRSYGFYAYGSEESGGQSSNEEARVSVQAAAEADVLSPDIDTVLSKVRSYILSKDTKPDYSSIWNVIGLKRSGLYVPESYTNLFYSNVIAYCESKDWQLTRAKYSDYSKLIIALTSIGVDARNVMGHNLLSYLSDYKNVSRQGNNGPIWALIALKCNPVYTIPVDSSAEQQNSEELLVKKVLEMQCADGGWTLMGDTGDSDMTGMAMQALASYYNKDGYEDVTAAINRGLTWISNNQLSSGGFGTMGTETSESVAQIITALCGIGIDCGKDSRFIKDGKWPMTGLFQYYMSEGGFMHVAAGAGNNGGGAGGTLDGMATEQGLYATVAYKRLLDGNTFLYNMSDVDIVPGTKPVVEPTIDTGSSDNGSSSATSTTTKKTNTTSQVKVIKVGLNYSTIYLTKGKSKTLKATISPSNASNKAVKWTSSNKNVATVSAKGKVTGKKAGTATITVKAKDGSGKKATCTVTVTAPVSSTQAKKTVATTAAKRQVTMPTSTGTASGTTKTLPSANSASSTTAVKAATGTTAKKKDTAAEATTGGWSFSGDNYVPETSTGDETEAAEDNIADSEKTSDKSNKGIHPGVLYVAGGVGGLVIIEALGFAIYKNRNNIAGVVKKIRKSKDMEE